MSPEPPLFGLFGEALALVSAVCFALSNVFISRGAVRASGDNGALLSVMVTALVSAALWIAMGAGLPGGNGDALLVSGLAWFALSGLLATVFGRIFLYKSIQQIGVTRASAIKRLNPFFSVLLAALILGEVITPMMGAGMLLIAVSFGTLLRRTALSLWMRGAGGEENALADYLHGPASALCYATSYIARRFGLERVPDAVFGTFVSALAALGYYLVAASLVRDYRRAFREALTAANPWQLAAAVFVSFGQIAVFGAIQFTAVSKVVMIASLEIFISMFLAVVVFEAEKRPEPMTVFAAVLATAGVCLVAFG